ncbi:hypothetical protein L1887_59179 [Cichorium endivia]|nr:hypothetical protein L1887_59179 [Cichorium endivia]
MDASYLDILATGLRLAVPLIFAALGGIWCERAGVFNLALEGSVLGGAFGAALGAFFLQKRVGRFAGVDYLRRDCIVAGLHDIACSGAGVDPGDRRYSVPAEFTCLSAIRPGATCLVASFRTSWGLNLRATGEYPRAADSAGLNVFRIRFLSVVGSCVIAGTGWLLFGAVTSLHVYRAHERGQRLHCPGGIDSRSMESSGRTSCLSVVRPGRCTATAFAIWSSGCALSAVRGAALCRIHCRTGDLRRKDQASGRRSMINNPIPWPGGARCAVAITFDMDADSFLHLHRPQTAISGSAPFQPCNTDRKSAYLLQSYRDLGLKQTFFVPAWCIEQYRPRSKRWSRTVMKSDTMATSMSTSTKSAKRKSCSGCVNLSISSNAHTGQKPRGFRAPLYNFSPATTDLLIAEGFKYDASLMGDDIPYILQGKTGQLVELPTHWAMDDWPPYVHMSDIDYSMPIRSPQEAISVYKAEFDAMPKVECGSPRWKKSPAHVSQVHDQGSANLRVERMPPYDGPVKFDKY